MNKYDDALAGAPVESDEQCIRCLDYRTHCDCPPAPPAGEGSKDG